MGLWQSVLIHIQRYTEIASKWKKCCDQLIWDSMSWILKNKRNILISYSRRTFCLQTVNSNAIFLLFLYKNSGLVPGVFLVQIREILSQKTVKQKKRIHNHVSFVLPISGTIFPEFELKTAKSLFWHIKSQKFTFKFYVCYYVDINVYM